MVERYIDIVKAGSSILPRCTMAKDYYEILGVSKNATKDEIKKAFHKKAHQYHPDKTGGDEGKFKEVNEAYQVLSDDKKRAAFDQYGNPDMAGSGAGGFDPSGFGFDFSNMNNGAGMEFDLGDIFGDMFGGGRGQQQKARRGRDMEMSIELTFEEAVFGIQKTVTLDRQGLCSVCSGTGGKPGTKIETCHTCQGQGFVQEVRRSFLGSFATNKQCDTCHGTGSRPKESCTHCKGKGVEYVHERVEVTIPAGVDTGQTLRVSGKGETIQGGSTGDLFLHIRVRPHKTFTREGYALHTDISIKLTDALLGTSYTLKTLDGEVVVEIPTGITHGQLLRVKDRGVPHGKSSRGDLILRVFIDMPKKLSKDVRKLIEQMREEGI